MYHFQTLYYRHLILKQFRRERGYSLKELADRTDLSISFLSEIEKGKKYPKPEKIAQLAHALDISFDELVSLKVNEELDAFKSLMDSPFLKEFPFELFDLARRTLLDLMTHSPGKAGAFLRTFLEIGQNYDMKVEHFLLAALRSYQKMNLNYFDEIEQAAMRFRKRHGGTVDFEHLLAVFTQKSGVQVEQTAFENHEELQGFRSIWVEDSPPKIMINKNLMPIQKAFVLGREIGYSDLELRQRTRTSSWIKIESFEQVLNNFKASYFAGALLIDRNL